MTDVKKAKEQLLSHDYTCVLCREHEMYCSTLRGVKPLVTWLTDKTMDFTDFSAADKVIGKATAFLYVLLGVKHIYTKIISQSALQILTDYQITITYDTLVPHIINRRGDGICPFETAVMDVQNPADAYDIIRNKMREMG